MDQKQKEELRILLKARKRADKVFARRREAEQKKLDYKMHKKANQELMKQYAEKLNALAQESGILAMAQQAVLDCGGSLKQKVSYYVYYGPAVGVMGHSLADGDEYGELRASHLSLRIIWGQPEKGNEAEIRIYKKGQITFHNNILPVFPFVWRRNPHLLKRMLASALKHPRVFSEPLKNRV